MIIQRKKNIRRYEMHIGLFWPRSCSVRLRIISMK